MNITIFVDCVFKFVVLHYFLGCYSRLYWNVGWDISISYDFQFTFITKRVSSQFLWLMVGLILAVHGFVVSFTADFSPIAGSTLCGNYWEYWEMFVGHPLIPREDIPDLIYRPVKF